MLGGFGQVHGGGLRFLRARCHLRRGVVDRADQVAKVFHREVDRVGDGAGHVLGDRGLDRQVVLGERTDFIQQAHDRLLVAVVELHRVFVALALGAVQRPEQAGQRQQREQAADDADPDVAQHALVVERAERGECGEQVLAVREQLVGTSSQRSGGGLRLEQGRRVGDDRVQVLLHRRPALGCEAQRGDCTGVAERLNVHALVALAQAVEHLLEHAHVTRQRIAGDGCAAATCLDFRDAARHVAGQHVLAQRDVDLRGGRAARGHRAHQLVELGLQLRHRLAEAVGVGGETAHCLFARGHLLGARGQRRPRRGHRVDRPGNAGGGAEVRVELRDVAVDPLLRVLERRERGGIPGHRLPALVGQALRVHLQARCRGTGTTQPRCLPARIARVGAEDHERRDQRRDPEVAPQPAPLDGDRIDYCAHRPYPCP